MDREKVKSDTVTIIAELAEIPEEEITEEAILQKLGVDSLMALQIVARMEKKYQVEIPEEEIGKIRTLRDILDMVDRLFTKQIP
jgi:acyl carrier protein